MPFTLSRFRPARRGTPMLLLAVPVLAVALAGTRPAQAQLVTNGGFETADFTGWTLSGNADYTSAAPNTFIFGLPHSGTYAAWLGAPTSDGFLSQSIATTAGHKYTVSYWLSVDTGGSALSAPNDFSASFGGQALINQTDLAPTDGHGDPADDYTQYTFTTVAAGPASVLQFGFRDDPSEFRLDDVSVADAGPVPEASTTVSLGLLLALGGGGLVLTARRRKARA